MLKRIVLLPVAIGVLAWPLMGGRGAGILSAGLFLGLALWQGTVSVASRLRRHGRLSQVVSAAVGQVTALPARLSSRMNAPTAWAVGVPLLLLPLFLNHYYLDTLGLAALYAILAVGLHITVGLTGLLDLGYAAFYGIGAYIYAVASTRMGVPFWPGLLLGGVVAALFGVLLGVVTLRLRGDYLAIVTLGFVQMVYLVLNGWESVTGGPNGILRIGRPILFDVVMKRPPHFYVLTVALLILTVVAVRRLMQSQIGRAWMAIRDDAVAAAAMGIDVTRMKIMAFAFGAGIAGMAGVVFAAKYTFVSPESFNFQESVRVLSMVVLGGMGSLGGAILGAALLTLLPEMLRDLENYRMLIFGLILIAVMVLRPQGLLGKAS